MKIKIQERAKKDLKKIDKQNVIKILKNIQKLENYPNISNIKILKNFYPPKRLRVGDYRVLFDVEENTIIIFNIKHRKDAYEK